MKSLLLYTIHNLIRAILIIELVIIFYPVCVYIYMINFSIEARNAEVRQAYDKIAAASGLGVKPILYIIEEDIVNAYTTGDKIVVYRGILNKVDINGAAFLLAHELAHVSLEHLKSIPASDQESEKKESLADKLGAYYTMRAGYDICKARQIWKVLRDEDGDYLGADHPGYSYRYNSLNIGCDKG